jgi:hypothetical protein
VAALKKAALEGGEPKVDADTTEMMPDLERHR